MSHAKQQFYHHLDKMSDKQLFSLAKRYIRLSDEAADRPRSFYHRMCNKVYGELESRGRSDLFDLASADVKNSAGNG